MDVGIFILFLATIHFSMYRIFSPPDLKKMKIGMYRI